MASIAREFASNDEAEAKERARARGGGGVQPGGGGTAASACAELAARRPTSSSCGEAEITRWVLATRPLEEEPGSGPRRRSRDATPLCTRAGARRAAGLQPGLRGWRAAGRCSDGGSTRPLARRRNAEGARAPARRPGRPTAEPDSQIHRRGGVGLPVACRHAATAAARGGGDGGRRRRGAAAGYVGGLPFESELAGGVPTSAALGSIAQWPSFARRPTRGGGERHHRRWRRRSSSSTTWCAAAARAQLRERIKSLQEEQLAMGAEPEELRSAARIVGARWGG